MRTLFNIGAVLIAITVIINGATYLISSKKKSCFIVEEIILIALEFALLSAKLFLS